MSDLYMVLRSRLESVAEWVTLGTDVMLQAMREQGLSHERAARMIPVTEKTWRRWVAKGQVQRRDLPKVVEILNLEIEQPARRRVVLREPVGDGVSPAKLQEALDRIAHLEDLVERLLATLDARDESGSRPSRRRTSRRSA